MTHNKDKSGTPGTSFELLYDNSLELSHLNNFNQLLHLNYFTRVTLLFATLLELI